MKRCDLGRGRILRALFGILTNELVEKLPSPQICSRQDAANGTLEACPPTGHERM